MKKHSVLFAITAGLIAGGASAGTMGSMTPQRDWTWLASISAGPVWARAGENQTFNLTPEIEKTYAARKSNEALASGELFVGVQKTLTDQWQGQIGLALAATSNAKLQGVIWDDADPEFDNHHYQYKVSHSRVVVKGKLLLDQGFWLTPWVSGSLGVGFNHAHDFSNTPLIFEALPNNNFTNNTKTAFTYTLGAGVQKALNPHWQIGVGYEFADWGKSELERAVGQTLNTGLTLNQLYTQGVLFNLTYLA